MAVIGIAGGMVVDLRAFGVDQPLLWAPDLAVGVVLIIAGASVNAARLRGPGVLLAAAGVAWFAGTAVPEATYWHRGVVVHLLVAYPGGRPASRVGWVLLGAGYSVAAISPLWRNDVTSLVVGGVGLAISVSAGRGTRIRRHLSSPSTSSRAMPSD